MISGEYLVLDGAKALAVPCRYGQYLTIKPTTDNFLLWTSLDEQGLPWYRVKLEKKDGVWISDKDDELTKRLVRALIAAQELNSGFLAENIGFEVQSKLEFNRDWGLGSSSTLLNNLALWAEVNAFELSERTFGGSGYDIACAKADHPIFFERIGNFPRIERAPFNPVFKSKLSFLHLNTKQDSRDAIGEFRKKDPVTEQQIRQISRISESMAGCKSFHKFRELMDEHEHLISGILNALPVKDRLFRDFEGSIKSLGAWGGDFVMIATDTDPGPYFMEKGYRTLLSYEDLILP